jgi:hypothetical protein
MHETSLGGTLRDYLTGEEVEETTYEEFRQALAKLLVEEKGYPKDRLRAKVRLAYTVDGEEFDRPIDLVVEGDDGSPIFVIIFCSGDIGTYERETVCAARLLGDRPASHALVTDTMGASLLDVKSGECIQEGMRAIPNWEELQKMVAEADSQPLTEEQRERQTRIFHAYNGFLFGTCCSESCSLPPTKKA